MLSIMALAYQGVSLAELLPRLEEEADRRRHLYNSYIRRVLDRRPLPDESYDERQALLWLRFLARRLTQREETQLFIEDLQPDWLLKDQRQAFRTLRGSVFGLVLGPLVGITSGVIFGLALGPLVGIASGVLAGLSVGLVVRAAVETFSELFVGWGENVKPVDELVWHRPSRLVLLGILGSGLVAGLTLAVIDWLVVGLVNGLASRLGVLLDDIELGLNLGLGMFDWLVVGLFLGLIFGSLLTLRLIESKRRNRPNQGIVRSSLNAISVGLFFGLVIGLFFGLVYGRFRGVVSGLVNGLFFGLFFGLFAGGDAVVKHFLLRLVLHRENLLPFHLVPFLDAMTQCILLQRAGAHYRFVHRTMQEHIASLTNAELRALLTPLSRTATRA